MDSQLVLRTRNQLSTRVCAAKNCPAPLFPTSVKHLLDWLEIHPLFRSLMQPLATSIATQRQRLTSLLEKARASAGTGSFHPPPFDEYLPSNREDAVALYFAMLREVSCLELRVCKTSLPYLLSYVVCGFERDRNKSALDPKEVADAMRNVALQGVHDYLDEQIEGRNVIIGLLTKYKTRCEMYRRQRLRDAATNGLEGRTSERALAFDLYEYLHDQGVDFWVESVSASGEPDLVSRDVHGERLVADAKYVDGASNVRKTVTSGFRQVLEYCRDRNEAVGYLVVFVNRDVVIDIKGERDDSFSCFRTGGYTVYYVFIDIFDHRVSASKRPKPTVIEISQQDVISDIQNGDEGLNE